MGDFSDQTTGGVEVVDAAWERVHAIQSDSQSPEQLRELYNTWAENYDKDLTDIGFDGPFLAAQFLAKQGLPKTARILDVAAGTGLIARHLQDDFGYDNLEALDGSPKMLEVASRDDLYREYHCCFIGGGATVPIPDDTFDGAVMCGVFCKTHLKLDAMDDVIRMVKPGGYIVNSMRDGNRKLDEYLEMDKDFREKTVRGLWEPVEEDTSHVYYPGYNALVQVFRVTKSRDLV